MADKLEIEADRMLRLYYANIFLEVEPDTSGKGASEELRANYATAFQQRRDSLIRDAKSCLLERVVLDEEGYINFEFIEHGQQTGTIPPSLMELIDSMLQTEEFLAPEELYHVDAVTRSNFLKTAKQLDNSLGVNLDMKIADTSNPSKYVSALFELALAMRATDIHIEPDSTNNYKSGVVKFRIDGRLMHIEDLSLHEYTAISNEVKEWAHRSMTAAEKQNVSHSIESSFTHPATPEIRYRYSYLSLGYGPGGTVDIAQGNELSATILRLLKNETKDLSLDGLGFVEDDINAIRLLVREKAGIILVTGSLCQGKTTTICSILERLYRDSNGTKSIITFEDPIEYQLKGPLQFKVSDHGMTYHDALRKALRLDFNVIFVGEIRDAESAKYIIDIAQSGHLAFATMHSSDALGTISRLSMLGVDAAAIYESLRGIVSQSLIPMVCPTCYETGRLTFDEARYFLQDKEREGYGAMIAALVERFEVARPSGIYQGSPCNECEGTGYRGLVPIVQLFINDMEYQPIITSICADGAEGPRKMSQLYRDGVFTCFGLSAVEQLFDQVTTPEVLIDLPPSYFSKHKEHITNRVAKSVAKSLE